MTAGLRTLNFAITKYSETGDGMKDADIIFCILMFAAMFFTVAISILISLE